MPVFVHAKSAGTTNNYWKLKANKDVCLPDKLECKPYIYIVIGITWLVSILSYHFRRKFYWSEFKNMKKSSFESKMGLVSLKDCTRSYGFYQQDLVW